MDVNRKILLLVIIVLAWVIFGLTIKALAETGYISKFPPLSEGITFENATDNFTNVNFNINAMQNFVYDKIMQNDGHINLEYSNASIDNSNQTNSEAASYFLLWNANARNKIEFDKELDFIKQYMVKKDYNYLMWRLEENNSVITDGGNIASDADLRTLKALYVAKDYWGDKKYQEMIDTLSRGLKNTVIIKNNLFVPYGGVKDGKIWQANEVYLSYSDFNVFRRLSLDKGDPWTGVYDSMKKAVLDSQLDNGLFNPVLNDKGQFANTIEEGYSINSLWVMVRSAESGDPELQKAARKGLDFYMKEYSQNKRLTGSYSANGSEIGGEATWAYALVGRAAIDLGEAEFSKEMINKVLEKQDLNSNSTFFGAIPEGNPAYVSQFTTQETILTLQDYAEKTAEQK